jgi:hypothetical protein
MPLQRKREQKTNNPICMTFIYESRMLMRVRIRAPLAAKRFSLNIR